jgi:hypothetical protein
VNAQLKPDIEPMLESSIDLKLAEQALEVQKNRLQWSNCKGFYTPIVNALQLIGAEPYLQGGTIYVSISGDKAKLTQAFKIFRTAGLEFSADRPKQGDSSWHAFFKHPDQTVDIFFQFSSSVCRRVKTGTKMQEVDVYETQCGDISVDDVALPAPLTLVPALEADGIPF